MNNLEELEKKYEELRKEIENLKKEKKEITRWRAKECETFSYIDDDGDIMYGNDERYGCDNFKYNIGNYFATDEEAENQLKKLKIYMQLKDLALKLNNGEKIDWNNEMQDKYYIYYDCDINKFEYGINNISKHIGQIYCQNTRFLDKALEEIGEENLKLLYEVESEE